MPNSKFQIPNSIAVLSFILVSISVFSTHAAELNFSSPKLVEDSENLYTSNLNLNTQGDNINTLEVSCRFPEDKFALKNILTGDSLLNFWIQKPEVENGILHFIGTIPAGYLGNNGKILTLVFQPKDTNTVLNLEVLNNGKNPSRVFLNDPLATEKIIQTNNYSLNVPADTNSETATNLTDVVSPEPFTIAISPSSALPKNNVFVIFNANDADSGIDHYEMAQADLTNDFYNNPSTQWQKVESPAVINVSQAKKFLAIKAIDKFNNTTIAVADLKPSPTRLMTRNLFTVGIVLFIIILIISSSYGCWRVRRKNK